MPDPINNALDCGFVADDPDFDNSIILNRVMKSSLDNLYFPFGKYYFNTLPEPIKRPFAIRGTGINATSLIKNYKSLDPNSALLHSFSSIVMQNFSINAGTGMSGGGAIRLEGLGASSSVLRDLYITGGYSATYDIPLALVATESMGIRDCCIDNVDIFSATSHLAWFVNIHGLYANINLYPAGGIANWMTIQHSGEFRSSNISINTHYLEKVFLYGTDNLTVRGIGNTEIVQTNCNNIRNV